MIDRVTWLGMLAKLATPADPVKSFQAMEAYLPFLADLPDEAFTRDSLRAVAVAERRLHIPDLREVSMPLEAWWKANRPQLLGLPAPRAEPAREPVDAETRASIARQMEELVAGMGGRKRDVVVPIRRSAPVPPEVLAQARAALAKRTEGCV